MANTQEQPLEIAAGARRNLLDRNPFQLGKLSAGCVERLEDGRDVILDRGQLDPERARDHISKLGQFASPYATIA